MNVLKRIRKSLCMTQAQAAKAMGVTQSNVSKLERGQGDIHVSHVTKLAASKGLRVSFSLEDV